jgi:hypothetical protein
MGRKLLLSGDKQANIPQRLRHERSHIVDEIGTALEISERISGLADAVKKAKFPSSYSIH